MSRGTKGSPRTVSFTRFMRDITPTMSPEAAAPQKALRKAKAESPRQQGDGQPVQQQNERLVQHLAQHRKHGDRVRPERKKRHRHGAGRPSRTVGTRPSGREYRSRRLSHPFCVLKVMAGRPREARPYSMARAGQAFMQAIQCMQCPSQRGRPSWMAMSLTGRAPYLPQPMQAPVARKARSFMKAPGKNAVHRPALEAVERPGVGVAEGPPGGDLPRGGLFARSRARNYLS